MTVEGLTLTGGRWDPAAWPTYFIASGAGTLEIGAKCHDWLLIAVNEMEGQNALDIVKRMCALGKNVFIDSGVFNLSTTHAKRHNMTMDEALAMAPDRVDGFADLLHRYVTLMRELGDQVWGYIEIDQGGRENKIKTRAKLEGMGLRPIPVYHPFNDGWDYFDYLAERYDRICLGNVVQADSQTRKRLIATAWERRRKYPNLWIHALGLTPSALTTAFPINSCDSSTWISGNRWGQHHAQSANKKIWETTKALSYDRSRDKGERGGWYDGVMLGGYESEIMRRQMAVMAGEQAEVLGCDIGMFEAQE